jgi:poly(A)-specific ribonuclease
VKEELLNKDHVLVGHNLFTDLCFLYQTFFEPLPMSVKNFQNEIHCLFPTLYDTKFLASYGYGSLRPNTSLGTLLEPYKFIHKPIVSLHSDEGFQSYRDATMNDKAHEAGYDSELFTTPKYSFTNC